MTDSSALHADQIAQAHRRLDAHDARHVKHDERLTSIEVHSARETERSQNIERSLSKIESGIAWINRLVIGGIIGGVIAFLLKGGFHV